MLIDETGNRYGCLTVISRGDNYVSPKGKKMTKWICQCDCGSCVEVSGLSLRRGSTKSCGCLLKTVGERQRKTCIYDMSGEYGVGYTTNTNEPFYFDKEDYDKIKDMCWLENDQGYIVSTERSKQAKTRLHRLVLGAKRGAIVDHINCNKKDNRKANLRFASKQTNGINRPCNKNNRLGIKGVSFRDGKYNARIMVDGKTIHLGRYGNLSDAVISRERAEKMFFGNFAYGGKDE